MNTKIILGYDYELWSSYNFKKEVLWNYEGSPHLIISGNTGSGKTVEALYILYQALNITKSIFIADFKGMGEWRDLLPDSHYAELGDCDALFEKFYHNFLSAQQENCPKPSFLFFDEFNTYALSKSKADFEHLQKMLSTLAFMARVAGVRMVLIGQDWHSTTLPTGIRNQFNKLHLGRITPEQMGMLFPSCDIKNMIPPKYAGFCLTEADFCTIQAPYIDRQLEGSLRELIRHTAYC